MGLLAALKLPALASRTATSVSRGSPKRESASDSSESSTPLQSGSPDQDQAGFEANLSVIADELRKALSSKAPDDASAEIQKRLNQAVQLMKEAASKAEYKLATEMLQEVGSLLMDFQRCEALAAERQRSDAAAAEAVYATELSAIGPSLNSIVKTNPPDPTLSELVNALRTVKASLEAAVKAKQFAAALQEVRYAKSLLERYTTAESASNLVRNEFLAESPKLDGEVLPILSERAPSLAIGKVQQNIAIITSEMAKRAEAGDYLSANTLRLKTLALIRQYRDLNAAYQQALADQLTAESEFVARYDILKPILEKMTAEIPPDDVTRKLRDEANQCDTQIQYAQQQTDYIGANEFSKRLSTISDKYAVAKAKAENDPKRNFERERPLIESALQGALKPPRTDPAMLAMQQAIRSKSEVMQKAVGKKDFKSALEALTELRSQLDTFATEEPKTPRSWKWVAGIAFSLMAETQYRFNDAANVLDDLANAYDAALKDYESVLDAAKERKRLQDAVLELVFMVALPGAIGGAGATVLKAWLGSAEKRAAGGALVDATKDVLKFVSKTTSQAGLKPPAAPSLSGLKGNGVTLTRSISKLLRNEQSNLMRQLDVLGKLMTDKADSDEPIRIEGDPRTWFANDPFLKVIGSIGAADKAGFATEIWRQWIHDYAYKIVELPYPLFRERNGIEQTFDDKMIPDIQKFVSKGFDVRRELEKSGAQLKDVAEHGPMA